MFLISQMAREQVNNLSIDFHFSIYYHKFTNYKLFLGVAGVMMYVGPFEVDFCAPNGVRELAVVDSSHNIVFLRIFGECARSYGDQLLLAEPNNTILMAHNMEVDHASSKTYFLFIYLIY